MKTTFKSKFKIDWTKSQLVYSTIDETVILTNIKYQTKDSFGGVVLHTNEKKSGLKVGEILEFVSKAEFTLFKGSLEIENE